VTTATGAAVVIDTPGVYEMSDDVYHLDPVPGGSLSSSGARRLLEPSCPALFHHWRHRAGPRTKAMDFGTVAHWRMLGVGSPIVVVDADDWKTKAAQKQRLAAHAAGRVPMLLKDYARTREMETALRADPDARNLFRPGVGAVEQSMFWLDFEFQTWRRARLDLVIPGDETHPMVIVDYKTTGAVDVASLAKTMVTYGYTQQGAWYIDAADALDLVPAAGVVFVLVFQMSDPPYLVRVAQPEPEAIQWGRVKNRKAIDTYRECERTGVWPGYPRGVVSLAMPNWTERQLEHEWESGAFSISTDTEGSES
jgi:hypothetical protein